MSKTMNGKNFFRLQDQKVYIGSGNLNQKLTPGVYTMKYDNRTGEAYIEEVAPAKIDKTVKTGQMGDILNLVEKFAFNVSNGIFDKHQYKSKFGIMLEGPPGTGKSQTVNSCTNAFVEKNGIVIFIGDNSVYHSGLAGQFLKKLNTIQPDLPILLVLEDLDSVPRQLEVYLTSILDGEQSPSNTFFLGTTNYLDKIPSRLIRPGRFDLIYKVDELDEATRKAYIDDKLNEFSIKASDEEKQSLYDVTNKFSFAEIRTFMAYIGFFGFESKDLAAKISRMDGKKNSYEPDIIPACQYDSPEDYQGIVEEDED